MIKHLSLFFEDVSPDDSYQVVRFVGEFDKIGMDEVRAGLDSFLDSFSLHYVVFDFSSLKFINSEGIGYLMKIHAHLVHLGKSLVVFGVNDHVKDVFETIGFSQIVSSYDSLNDFLNTL